MIWDVEKVLGNEHLVGHKLDDLLYPPEVNKRRKEYPDPSELNIAIEIPSQWTWEV